MRRIFIINPRSGTPKYVRLLHYLIRKHLGARNNNVSIIKSRNAAHVREVARRAAEDGCDMVIAVGGDGTINQVARGIVNSDTALGVIPAGSGNGFASNIGLPRRRDKALELLLDPTYKRIDVGSVADEIFLVSCGIGWEAVIATMFEGSRIRGFWPYLNAAFSTYLQYEPQEIEIESSGEDWKYHGRPMLFSIANFPDYGLGITIAPHARPDDGMLDVCMVHRKTLLDDIKVLGEMLPLGTKVIPGLISKQAPELTIHRTIPGNIHVDGTPVAAGCTINIKVMPKALKVAVRGE